MQSLHKQSSARVLRLGGDSYRTPRMWPVYGRQDAPEHGGPMVTKPVLVFLLQPPQIGPCALQEQSRARAISSRSCCSHRSRSSV
ncbi:hypothetical protein [Streptomyces sp. NPDC086182]|uniref:hypothetical protein n=1 Tax=Streptomyces sp. NPDC086182 TaxID=3155058 RepID=UPI00342CBCA5